MSVIIVCPEYLVVLWSSHFMYTVIASHFMLVLYLRALQDIGITVFIVNEDNKKRK